MRWRRKNLAEWHSVFCWMPDAVDGVNVWLERIERRQTGGNMYGDCFEYRLTKSSMRDQRGEREAPIGKFFKLPLRFVEPLTNSDWPKVVDADGLTVAHLFWPAHDSDETERAEQATYALGRGFAAIIQGDAP